MLFKSTFLTLRTLWISPLQCCETFEKFCFFCTIWLLRNFYSGEAHHANDGERCSNHHFPHCAHCVYQTYSVFKLFKIAVCFEPFGFYEISTPVMHTMLTTVNVVQIFISDIAHIVFITFTVFWNFSKLLFGLHILALRNFYSGDAHPADYGERCSKHPLKHCANCLYHFYSVLKLSKNSLCFAPFGF